MAESKKIIDTWNSYHASEGETFELVYVSGEEIEMDKSIVNFVVENRSGEVDVLSSEKRDVFPYAPGHTIVVEARINNSGSLVFFFPDNISGLPGDRWASLEKVMSLGEGEPVQDFFRDKVEDTREALDTATEVVTRSVEDVEQKASRSNRTLDILSVAFPIVVAGLLALQILDLTE